ncbi:MAG TPA: hypothetical protein PKW76_14055 [bacterium]|nr:hypothetical protein [bacterium]HPG46797.1 hypothetical protein [bacterium]HPM98873.1 hypothetical protein [bacterium]
MKSFKVSLLIVLPLMILRFTACERPTAPEIANLEPNTTLANIPVENDTIFALATLHWDGEDYDGFVAAFEYRYITRHIYFGDSLVQPWQRIDKTSQTIAFESSDELNHQRFQIRAIDDKGAVDPTPAEKRFFTYQTTFPITTLLSPVPDQQFFIIDGVTDWWQGLPITFTAKDLDFNGAVVEYAWAVDDGPWQWTQDTTVFIGPEHFSPLEGNHTIRVTSRDNTNLVDPVGDSAVIKTIRPIRDREILIIDETIESSFPFGVTYSDADVDQFYSDVFGSNFTWDFSQKGIPPKDTLARYQMIIWHADNTFSNPTDAHKLSHHIEVIMDYLNTGGDLIMSGWRILKSFEPKTPFPLTFLEGTFIHDYLHINIVDETVALPDFIGANGVGDYSDIQVDANKLATAFPYFGKLDQINIIPSRAGFTEAIYTYKNENNSNLWQYRGRPCGLRYFGTSFDAVVFGFPIFFIEKQDALVLGQEVLSSLGY